MAETRKDQESAEQRVFGNTFSLDNPGEAGENVREAYVVERVTAIAEGQTMWLARTSDADNGVCADLYSRSAVVATLDFDYDDGSATVYTTSECGSFGDTVLCDRIPFDKAVDIAEQFAADQA